ncbi:MAG: MFS transporter [Aeromonas popoffii]|uniref:MFS transporter n=1 Tax=Aeromonas popoffii TaxID=70856 RepID=UPI003F2B0179
MANQTVSPWAPFRQRAFLVLWLATLFSNVGTWMHDVGAGWLMTSLDPDPGMIAAVQAMTTLPVFLLALLAGALADILDRRRLLLVVNAMMLMASAFLAFQVQRGGISSHGLLLITFLLGCGAAFLAPAWQAIVPSLLDRKELQAGIALNSMGINISRAIGPALAGLLIAQVGMAIPFLLNGISFLAILAALWWWRGETDAHQRLPAERVLPAMVTGLRYARRSPALIGVLLRSAAFFLFASAYWAMLPLVVRLQLKGDATLYGTLTACVGIGAVLGALLLPRLRRRLSGHHIVMLGSVGTALVLLVLATSRSAPLALLAGLLAGASWIATLSSLVIAAQGALPDWVRARGLSLYLTVFSGAMALGSISWGLVASHVGVTGTLLTAASGILLLLPFTTRVRLDGGDRSLTPSRHWPEPDPVDPAQQQTGPVMIHVRYRVMSGQEAPFKVLLRQLGETRHRDGGLEWHLFRDQEGDGFIETFVLPTWLDHLRQHERVTDEEQQLQAQIRALCHEVRVEHYHAAG